MEGYVSYESHLAFPMKPIDFGSIILHIGKTGFWT